MNERKMLIEKTVIGHLFSFYIELEKYVPTLECDDFEYYVKEFELIKKAYASDKKYDAVLLLGEAYDMGLGETVTECCGEAVTVFAFGAYLNELKELASAKRLCDGVLELYRKRELSIESLGGIIEAEKGRSLCTDAGERAAARLEGYLATLGKKEARIYTGFSLMDKVIGGFRCGTVCYIGARPSTGKTSFAINIAQKQIHKRVLFFSLEMSAEMIFDRYASALAGIDYSRFCMQNLGTGDIADVKNALASVAERKNLLVLDDVYAIEAIGSLCMRLKPDLIIIDYIQKVATTKGVGSMREKIEYISGELKKLARESGSVVICLSQLSRDGQGAPTMSNLKESGALEADGDYIIILHRPFIQEKRLDINPEQTDVLIDKNKFGETGLIKMRFDGSRQCFCEEVASRGGLL